MSTNELLEHWTQWAWHKGAEARQAILVADIDNLIFEEMENNFFDNLLMAVGLTAVFEMEKLVRVRQGLPLSRKEEFIRSATPLFLGPVDFLRALHAGCQFQGPPQGVEVILPGGDWRQESGSLGRDHGVGGGAKNVYPILRKPK